MNETVAWTLWGVGMAAGIGGMALIVVALIDLGRRTHVGWPWQRN